MKYSNIKSLKDFLKDCQNVLFSPENRTVIHYSDEAIGNTWDINKIKEDNNTFLKSISGSANVYAIYIKESGVTEPTLKYIGQTKSKYARTRLTNHLIKKHEGTGAKLASITRIVNSGGAVLVSWIPLDVESMRHYIEEELIKSERPEWNIQG